MRAHRSPIIHFAGGVYSLNEDKPHSHIAAGAPLSKSLYLAASLQLQLAGPGHEPSWLRSWLLARASTNSPLQLGSAAANHSRMQEASSAYSHPLMNQVLKPGWGGTDCIAQVSGARSRVSGKQKKTPLNAAP